jgi:hypothetical protein
MQDQTPLPPPEEYELSLSEAAALVSWSESTLRRWVTDGQPGQGVLPAHRGPDGLRFRTRDLIAYLAPDLELPEALTQEWVEMVREAAATVARLGGRAARERQGHLENTGERQLHQGHAQPTRPEEMVNTMDRIEATRAMAEAYREAALGHKTIAQALADAVKAASRIGELLGESDDTGTHILVASDLDRQAWHHAETAVSLSEAAEALMDNAQLRSASLRLSEE